MAATPEGDKISRLERMKTPVMPEDTDDEDAPLEAPQEAQEIPFPELPEGADYLVSLFHSAGIATQTGMGLVPLSWQEIESWVACCGLDESVTPWELGVVRKMSEAYASEYTQASAPRRPQPYSPEVDPDEIDRDAVMAKAISVLAAFKNKT